MFSIVISVAVLIFAFGILFLSFPKESEEIVEARKLYGKIEK